MKYCLIIPTILAILTPVISDAQNLIINPSFEDYTQCPYALGQTDFCTNWQSSLGTCDYYHECKFDFGVGVPSNLNGSQYAFDGLGYCGLVTFDNVDQNYREVLSAELSAVLEIGTTYFFSMRFCRAGEGTQNALACNKLGIKLSTSGETPLVDNSALMYSEELVVDTTFWHILNGSFVASQEYSKIHIGNFFDDANVEIVTDGPGNPTWAYYFIDDVRLSSDSTEMHVFVSSVPSAHSPKGIVVNGDRSVFLSFLTKATKAYLYTCFGSLCMQYNSPMDGNVDFNSLAPGFYFMKYYKENGTYEVIELLID